MEVEQILAAWGVSFPKVASWVPLLVSPPLQALSQNHPSGFQAHTQLQLPEWLSRPAASLLTEVRYWLT